MHLYANGSQNHITFLDERDKRVTSVPAPDYQLSNQLLTPVTVSCCMVLMLSVDPGVRSLSFYEDILTIGGGRGKVAFYDIRAFKYLERNGFNDQPWSVCYLCAGRGYLARHCLFLSLDIVF